MTQPNQTEPLSLDAPKIVAAALAFGGKLVRTEELPGGRLAFLVGHLPSNFLTRLTNDEITVSARKFIASMDLVLGMIAQHQQRGRSWR